MDDFFVKDEYNHRRKRYFGGLMHEKLVSSVPLRLTGDKSVVILK